uniref:MADF domain-containing protein n=1 Tax=Glossina pallidipes TaxID=7398 RepID=A0A1A9Z0F6_GLOPL
METTQKRRRYQKDSAPTDDIVTLIHLVRQNPTLYNYKLQPNQRRRIDILNGWAQIAAQIGNKYTVEECRRKWKNLRDTYHQYRLRKTKIGDGLSKWRYAKDMEFLSNVYQPKLKSHRTQNFNNTNAQDAQDNLLQGVIGGNDDNKHVVSQDMVHSSIISVNDTDTFILTAYEDVTHDNDVTHEDPNMSHVSHNELNHDTNSMEGCVEIVKHEQHNSLDDDGPNGGEVDYEEVCLYEEAGNAPSVDCETIIGGTGGGNSANSDDTKFQYIDANDFCISTINPTPRSQYSSSASSVIGATGTIKLKNLPIVSSSTASLTPSTSSTLDTSASCVTIASSTVHLHSLPELTPSPAAANPTTTVAKSENQADSSFTQAPLINFPSTPVSSIANFASAYCALQREECDLFFDFLKKKVQRFPPEEITSIQVEFLNCVLRREAEHAQKNAQLHQHNNNSNNNNNTNNNNNNNVTLK